MRYAGFWRRTTAYGIDGTIVQLIAFAVIWLLGSVANAQEVSQQSIDTLVQMGWLPPPQPGQNIYDIINNSGNNPALRLPTLSDLFIAMMISGIYTIWFTAMPSMATHGKRWCGLVVVHADGRGLSLGASALRWFASGASWLPFGLGFAMAGFSHEKTAMHDAICGTRVVYKNSLPPPPVIPA